MRNGPVRTVNVLLAVLTLSTGYTTADNDSCTQPGPGRLSTSHRQQVESLVIGAERTRVDTHDVGRDSVLIKIEDDPFERVGSIAFYRAYDKLTIPAYVYVVAIDATGKLYRIRGFIDREFDSLLRNWSTDESGSEVAGPVDWVAAYFLTTELWEPGVVRTPEQDLGLRVALSGEELPSERMIALEPLTTERRARLLIFNLTLHDTRSGRVERVEVAISPSSGIEVRSRHVVEEGQGHHF